MKQKLISKKDKHILQEVHGLFLDFFLRTSSLIQSDQESKVTAWETPDPQEKCCVTIEVRHEADCQ